MIQKFERVLTQLTQWKPQTNFGSTPEDMKRKPNGIKYQCNTKRSLALEARKKKGTDIFSQNWPNLSD